MKILIETFIDLVKIYSPTGNEEDRAEEVSRRF